MEVFKLNIFYFLVYIEFVIILCHILQFVLNFIFSIILILFHLEYSKFNRVSLYTEPVIMFVMIMVSTHLAYINTSDSLLGTKLLYYLSSTFLLAMHTVVHQNALDDASIYIDDALPHAQAKQFLRISLWFYLLFFILFTFIFYKGSNPVSELYITIIHWTLNLKYIGWKFRFVGWKFKFARWKF